MNFPKGVKSAINYHVIDSPCSTMSTMRLFQQEVLVDIIRHKTFILRLKRYNITKDEYSTFK